MLRRGQLTGSSLPSQGRHVDPSTFARLGDAKGDSVPAACRQPPGTVGETGQKGAQDPGDQTLALPETCQTFSEAVSFSPNS